MDTSEAAWITTYLSVLLGAIAVQAIVVAAFRVLQLLRAGDPASFARVVGLAALILFMSGAVGREAVVVVSGTVNWSVYAILWSGAARAVQVAGAALFIWNITRPVCGNWFWVLSLAVATAASILVVR